MRHYHDGNRVEIDKRNLVLNVFNDTDCIYFSISGFSSIANIDQFLNFGDLDTQGSDNDYLTLTGSTEKLVWTEKT